MTFKKFINEELVDYSDLHPEDIIQLIYKDCKPWIERSNKKMAYRGMRVNDKVFFKKDVRTDRKPKDTSLNIHNFINETFYKIHGVKDIRSSSLFVTGGRSDLSYYGNIFMIFPIGNFTFWWNKEVDDLYTYRFWGNISFEKITYSDTLEGNTDIAKTFKQLIKNYIDKNLYGALNSKNEIMIQCKEYYAARYEYEPFKDLFRNDKWKFL